ncbi:unnamed protein product [Hermetia illucens]|uniref:L-lactate dehydrogenase n=1 Tax=Hermetia illucens TaxID=343691 RepID=A0A7R8UMB7_HERIL|nr:L-lactate dehydrogenase-like [Hermetia illucens]CAD7083456.1 unnamed protein product [Hermetia illucens]
MAAFSTDFFMEKVSAKRATFDRKVTIVGADKVGTACANALLNRKVASEICIVDTHHSSVLAEILDIQHGATFVNNAKVTGGKDYSLSSGSQVIIIATDATHKTRESRPDIIQRNIHVMKDVIPKIMAHNKNPILLILGRPCEVMTFLAWKVSGLPKNRVFGIGTSIDTARFRYFLSERLGVAPTECTGWIIGEEGDLSIPVWSSLNVGGIRLRDVYPNIGKQDKDKDNWASLHKQVVDVSYEILESKGYANWGVSMACATIVHDIFNNTGCIRAVCTAAMNQYGIDKNIFLSFPSVITSDGVTNVVKLPLDQDEVAKIQEVARNVYKKMCQLKV